MDSGYDNQDCVQHRVQHSVELLVTNDVCHEALDAPHQPQLDYSSLSKKRQGNICRSFQQSWFC